MKTVVVASNGTIFYGSNNRGDGLDLNGTQGDVMVEIPKFWICSTYTNPYFYYYISPVAAAGYEVHPMFNQRMPVGVTTPAPYYYVARYDANDGGSSKLQSATGKTPLVSQTIGTFRTMAENKGSGWGITNIWTLSGIRQLFYTEMLTLNSQTAWVGSRGVVDNIWDGSPDGYLSGENSSDIKIFTNNATGNGTGINGKTPVVYRGMENLWGNVWQFQDGFNAVQGTTNIINKTGFNTSNGRTTFRDLMVSTDVTDVGALLTTDGFQSNLMNAGVSRALFLPSNITGGADNKYLADYYYYPRSTNVNAPDILLSGGGWDRAGDAGVGYLNAYYDASISAANLGARLEFRLSVAPTSSFTTNSTSGTAPLNVQFNDTSTNTPTTWQWNATNVSGNNTPFTFSTTQNASAVFGVGNFSIKLNASNAGGSNISTQVTWINVSSGVIIPIVQWTLDKPTVRFPGTIIVNDTSLNTPTSWQYYWGDGTANGTTKNATHQYVKRGVFQVTLNVTNSAGSNISAPQQVRVVGY
jgi:PKD repeat protein